MLGSKEEMESRLLQRLQKAIQEKEAVLNNRN